MAIGFFWATVCLCLFVTILALDIMGFFSWKNHFEVDGRVSEQLLDTRSGYILTVFRRPLSLEARRAWAEGSGNCSLRKAPTS